MIINQRGKIGGLFMGVIGGLWDYGIICEGLFMLFWDYLWELFRMIIYGVLFIGETKGGH